MVNNSPASTGDMGLIPGLGKICPVEVNCNLLQYSCLEMSMARGAWLATVYRVTKRRTQSHCHLTLFSVSYVVVLGWGQEICFYHKFPEDAGI